MRRGTFVWLAVLVACSDDGGSAGDTEGSSTVSSTTATGGPTSDGTSTTSPGSSTGGETDTEGTTGGGDPVALFGGGSRLSAHSFDAGEGATALRYWEDTELDLECVFVETTPGLFHCLPTTRVGSEFSDDTCTTPITTGTGIPAGELVTREQPIACEGPLASVWETGAVTDYPQIYYSPNGVSCVELGPAQGRPLTLRSLDDFVAGASTLVGEGPLRAVRVDGDDGSFQSWSLSDAAEARCLPRSIDGPAGPTLRCVPSPLATVPSFYYADAACTEPDLAWLPGDWGVACSEPPQFASRTTSQQGCNVEYTWYQVGNEVDVDAVFYDFDPCGPVSQDPENFAAERWFALGPLTDGSTLAEVTKMLVGSDALQLELVVDETGTPIHQNSTYDTWRLPGGEPCSPWITADGTWRCFPWMAFEVPDPPTWFSDAACSMPVVGFNQTCLAGTPFFRTTDGDGAITSIAEANVHDGQIYADDGGCGPVASEPEFVYLAPGDPLPLDTYPELSARSD
jgi:hypothetical protein